MPASIAHMLISRRVRNRLDQSADTKKIAEVLKKHPEYMELGSQGPDLPYFRPKSVIDPNLPLGIDSRSYQLHSKDPNIFPLKMIEVIGRESNPQIENDWEDSDDCKFSFMCGFLTHVAADQTIHPIVNCISGSYYHDKAARIEHKNCEMHQDLYILSQETDGKMPKSQFRSYNFDQWCNIKCDKWRTMPTKGVKFSVWDTFWWARRFLCPPPCPIEFVYFLQRSFVEAHAVRPREYQVESWLKNLWRILRKVNHPGKCYILREINVPGKLYQKAYKNLFDKEGLLKQNDQTYRKYILLEGAKFKKHDTYDGYLDAAIELAIIYICAAKKLYDVDRINDPLRHMFKSVVVNADLGAPLEQDTLDVAKEHFADWDIMLERFKALFAPDRH